jgi:hypothetical protein
MPVKGEGIIEFSEIIALLLGTRHAGSPIKLRTGAIQHPVAEQSENTLDSLRGEFIEPRVKPGMT